MRIGALRSGLVLLFTLLAGRADAIVLLDGKLNIAGYGTWAYARTNGNAFQLGTADGYYDNAAIALAVRAQATDELSASIQLTQDEDSTQNGIDYAFFEWKVSDAVRFRFGMPKVPLGISWDVNDVGTLRPFLRLPNSVYGSTNLGGYSYLGAGLAGTAPLPGGWELGYDLFAGGLSQFVVSPVDAVAVQNGTSSNPASPGSWVEMQDVVGGRLSLLTPIPGLIVRGSGFWGRTPEGSGLKATWISAASLEYSDEVWLLRSEYYRGNERGFGATDAGYVEAGARLGAHWQVVAKVEATRLDWPDFTGPRSLLRHREAALGLNYWFSHDFVLKASVHALDGNRFTLPDKNNEFRERTNEVMVGSQFSF
jgi:hypothetical protein